MLDFDRIMNVPPFSVQRAEKRQLLGEALTELTSYHYHACDSYRKILNAYGYELNGRHELEDFPFLPARIFKEIELRSVGKEEVFKVMTSSGTTGQRTSQIFLDRITASRQTKVLSKIVASFIGTKRLPMLVIDSPALLKTRDRFSARTAGVLGFSLFGKHITYALDEEMRINIPEVVSFLKKHSEVPVLIYGFTSIIWEYFVLPLKESRQNLSLENGYLIHGGGWKKLADQAVDNEEFKLRLRSQFKLSKVFNYYGMVEQAGSIYMGCEHDVFHAPIYSDVLIRNDDLSHNQSTKSGLIELLSIVPSSYPGHVILTEDLGEILGEDDCRCGRFGTYFRVKGRAQNAEIRGCSDTFARS